MLKYKDGVAISIENCLALEQEIKTFLAEPKPYIGSRVTELMGRTLPFLVAIRLNRYEFNIESRTWYAIKSQIEKVLRDKGPGKGLSERENEVLYMAYSFVTRVHLISQMARKDIPNVLHR